MPTLSVEESQLKPLLKSALLEVLDERRDLLVEVVEEALEDIAFLNAIKEAEISETVSRGEVFDLLEKKYEN